MPHWRSRRQSAPPNPWLPPTCQPRTELFASHRMIQGQGVWLDSSSGFKFILDLIGFCSAAVTIPKYVIPPFFKMLFCILSVTSGFPDIPWRSIFFCSMLWFFDIFPFTRHRQKCSLQQQVHNLLLTSLQWGRDGKGKALTTYINLHN